MGRGRLAATRLEHLQQPLTLGEHRIKHRLLPVGPLRVTTLDTQDVVQHHHIAATQQADIQRELQRSDKTMPRLGQGGQPFPHIRATQQRIAEPPQDIDRKGLENRQQVFALEDRAGGRQRGVLKTNRQLQIVGVPEHALRQHQVDVGLLDQDLRLAFDTGAKQLVVIIEKLDEFALGQLKTREQISHMPELERVTDITYRPARLFTHGLDQTANFVILAVIAHDDFEIAVALAQGTVQGFAKKAWIDGGNDETDEWDWVHDGARKRRDSPDRTSHWNR